MSDIARIADTLRRAHDGDAWHGLAIGEALADVTASEAAWRGPGVAHGIWEIALHATTWAREVARRLRTGAADHPEDDDWPALPEQPGEGAWRETRERLAAAHAELQEALMAFDEDRLDDRMGDRRDPALGTGVSFHAMLYGLAQHDAYHAGQVAVLKRLVRSSGVR